MERSNAALEAHKQSIANTMAGKVTTGIEIETPAAHSAVQHPRC